jgi:hypothetical protein
VLRAVVEALSVPWLVPEGVRVGVPLALPPLDALLTGEEDGVGLGKGVEVAEGEGVPDTVITLDRVPIPLPLPVALSTAGLVGVGVSPPLTLPSPEEDWLGDTEAVGKRGEAVLPALREPLGEANPLDVGLRVRVWVLAWEMDWGALCVPLLVLARESV